MTTETKSEPAPAVAEPSLLSAAAPSTAEGDAAVVPSPAEVRPDYGDFALPEGAAVDPADLASATELFHAASLSKEQAQKFIDLAVARDRAAMERGVKAFGDLQQRWVTEIKADPDIGGPRLDASIASANRAIERLGVPGLRDALNLTGAGNNPAVVKAFVRVGQMMQEDRFAPGRAPAPVGSRRSPAEIIYDGNPKQPKE